jgi:ribose 5-phosphate isomerase B
MRVAIGSDHAGYRLKRFLCPKLREAGHEIIDVGTDSEKSVDYPDFARAAAEKVREGEAERGIVICSTGIGISIAANKVRGIRAALCRSEYEAEFARLHNNANVLALGANVTGPGLAWAITQVFLATNFPGEERHARRVAKVAAIEAQD